MGGGGGGWGWGVGARSRLLTATEEPTGSRCVAVSGAPGAKRKIVFFLNMKNMFFQIFDLGLRTSDPRCTIFSFCFGISLVFTLFLKKWAA